MGKRMSDTIGIPDAIFANTEYKHLKNEANFGTYG